MFGGLGNTNWDDPDAEVDFDEGNIQYPEVERILEDYPKVSTLTGQLRLRFPTRSGDVVVNLSSTKDPTIKGPIEHDANVYCNYAIDFVKQSNDWMYYEYPNILVLRNQRDFEKKFTEYEREKNLTDTPP